MYEKLQIPGVESAEAMFSENDEVKSDDIKMMEDIPQLPGIKVRDLDAGKSDDDDGGEDDKYQVEGRKEKNEDKDDLDEDIVDDVYVNDDRDEDDEDEESANDRRIKSKKVHDDNNVSKKKKKPDITDFMINTREPDTSFIPADEISKDIMNTEIENKQYDFSRTNGRNNYPSFQVVNKTPPFDPQYHQHHPHYHHHETTVHPTLKPMARRLVPATLPPRVNYLPRKLNHSVVITRLTPPPPPPSTPPTRSPRMLGFDRLHGLPLHNNHNNLNNGGRSLSSSSSSPPDEAGKLFLLPFGSRTSSATGKFFKPISSSSIDRSNPSAQNNERGRYKDNSKINGRFGPEMDDFRRISVSSNEPETFGIQQEKKQIDKNDEDDDFYSKTMKNLKSRRLLRNKRDSSAHESDINLQLQQLDEIESIYEDHPALMANPPRSVDELLRRLVIQQIMDESPSFSINGGIYSPNSGMTASGSPAARTTLAINSVKQFPRLMPVIKHPIADDSKRVEEIVVNYLAPEPATPNYLLRSNEVYPFNTMSMVRNSAEHAPEIQINPQTLSSMDESIEPISMSQYNQLMYNLNNLGSIFSETSAITGPMVSDIRPKFVDSMPETIQMATINSEHFYPREVYGEQKYKSNNNNNKKNYLSSIFRKIPHQLSAILSNNNRVNLISSNVHNHGQVPRNSRKLSWLRRRSELLRKKKMESQEVHFPESSNLDPLIAQIPLMTITPTNSMETSTSSSPIRKLFRSFAGKKGQN